MALAELSVLLADLFSHPVVCAELLGTGNPDGLLPAEAKHVVRAVASRREEFAAGRECARRALREFGIVDFPLQAAEDRRVLWPEGFTGSITHTKGFCAAAVAQRRAVRAVGIDTERNRSVKPELWPRICEPEMEWLSGLHEIHRAAAATLIFCIKEAFYKCQYELTGQYLGFSDAHVELAEWNEMAGSFAVHPCKPIQLAQHMGLPLTGRYRFHREFVTAATAVPQ